MKINQHINYIVVLLLSCIVFPFESYASQLDKETLMVIETVIKGNEENNSRIIDMKMSSELKETISVDDEIELFYHIVIDYYQLGDKKRTDSIHSEDSNASDLLKNNTSKWIYTGENVLSYFEGTTLCSIGPAIDKMKLTTYILNHDRRTPSFTNFIEEIKYYVDRYDSTKDRIEIKTVEEEKRKLIEITYSTIRGGKGERKIVIDPLKGYQVTYCESEVYFPDGKLWKTNKTNYKIEEVISNVWKPIGCFSEVTELNIQKNQLRTAKREFETDFYEANTGMISDSTFTFEGMGVLPGTPVADLTFDPPIEYSFKSAPFSDVDLEALWSDSQSPIDVSTSTNKDINNLSTAKPSSKSSSTSITENKDNKSIPFYTQSQFLSTIVKVYLPICICLILGLLIGWRLKFNKK
ncbi:MAG: hypothetical protein JXA96_09775 [Sedimentisphaerales bacterium]|nr:hypothetical protein [Sedimentisphaerales bacterium]